MLRIWSYERLEGLKLKFQSSHKMDDLVKVSVRIEMSKTRGAMMFDW